MKEYLTCAECQHCKPQGIRKDGFMGAGYKYGICGQGGNLVFLEPWKEKRIYGSGYISHKASGCGRYSPNEHGRELRGLPPTEISYASGTDYGVDNN